MAKKLTNIGKLEDAPEPLVSVEIKELRPVLGMTLVKTTGAYSLDSLSKLSKKNPDLKVFDEIQSLQKQMYSCTNITDFFTRFHTRNGELNPTENDTLKEEIRRIKKTFDAEFDSPIRHIHSRPLGKGTFTLFGFVYENVFEILLIDPTHEISDN